MTSLSYLSYFFPWVKIVCELFSVYSRPPPHSLFWMCTHTCSIATPLIPDSKVISKQNIISTSYFFFLLSNWTIILYDCIQFCFILLFSFPCLKLKMKMKMKKRHLEDEESCRGTTIELLYPSLGSDVSICPEKTFLLGYVWNVLLFIYEIFRDESKRKTKSLLSRSAVMSIDGEDWKIILKMLTCHFWHVLVHDLIDFNLYEIFKTMIIPWNFEP